LHGFELAVLVAVADRTAIGPSLAGQLAVGIEALPYGPIYTNGNKGAGRDFISCCMSMGYFRSTPDLLHQGSQTNSTANHSGCDS
jgi:hypothetical protein